MKRLLRTVLPVLTGLSGCTYSSHYPDQWPPLASPAAHAECIDITGVYQNRGERLPPQMPEEGETAPSPYLTNYFFAEGRRAAYAGTVEVGRISRQQMMITAHLPDGSLMAVSKRQDVDFTCQDERIIISLAGNVNMVEGSRGKSVVMMAKAVDGSLVGDVFVSDTVLFDYVPVSGAASLWHRFAPAD